MCRYAIYGPYKEHFVCFGCRKTFKQTNRADWNNSFVQYPDHIFKCPDCSNPMANMGMDFRAPKKSDVKDWRRIEGTFVLGHIYRTCGCYGPGFVPSNQIEYREYLEDKLAKYKCRMNSVQTDPAIDAEERNKHVEQWNSRIRMVESELVNS